MTCDSIRDQFDEYLAATLDPERRTAFDDHLAGCAECRADLDHARFLSVRTAGLRREIAPPTDLWAGIAPRLAAKTRRLSLPLWSLAAAALVLVAASSALTVTLVRRQSAQAAAGFASTEARYQEAALEVAAVYRRSRDSLAPDTRAVLERNLAVIERALAESREALRTDPANRVLEQMVVAAYQRKIDFLERAAALDRKS